MELPQSDKRLRFLFVCKICQYSVNTVDEFVRHKKHVHFTDFQQLKFIVFEEKLNNYVGVAQEFNKVCVSDTEPSLIADTETLSVKQEFILEDERNHEVTHEEFNHNHPTSTSFTVLDSTAQTKSEFQNEAAQFQSDYSTSDCTSHDLSSEFNINPLFTPIVRIPHLTSEEIESAAQAMQVTSTSKQVMNVHKQIPLIDIELKPELSESPGIDPFIPEGASNTSQVLHQCPVCSKIFDCESQFKIHEGICQLYNQRTLQTTSNECDVCHKKFKKAQGLKFHKWSIHNNSDVVAISSRAVMCPHPGCSKTFENKRFLNCHKAKAHGLPSAKCQVRKFVCKENNCGKAYKCKINLDYHIKQKHGKDKNLPVFTCEICFKTFFVIQLLNSHSLVHTNDRPFKCQVHGCNAAFKRKQDLERHGMCHQ